MLKFNSRTACIFKSQLFQNQFQKGLIGQILITQIKAVPVVGISFSYLINIMLFYFFFFFTATRTEKILFSECKILQNYKLHPLRIEVTLIINMQ